MSCKDECTNYAPKPPEPSKSAKSCKTCNLWDEQMGECSDASLWSRERIVHCWRPRLMEPPAPQQPSFTTSDGDPITISAPPFEEPVRIATGFIPSEPPALKPRRVSREDMERIAREAREISRPFHEARVLDLEMLHIPMSPAPHRYDGRIAKSLPGWVFGRKEPPAPDYSQCSDCAHYGHVPMSCTMGDEGSTPGIPDCPKHKRIPQDEGRRQNIYPKEWRKDDLAWLYVELYRITAIHDDRADAEAIDGGHVFNAPLPDLTIPTRSQLARPLGDSEVMVWAWETNDGMSDNYVRVAFQECGTVSRPFIRKRIEAIALGLIIVSASQVERHYGGNPPKE